MSNSNARGDVCFSERSANEIEGVRALSLGVEPCAFASG
jgi:hypothetical protein